jgi:RNA polymerase sigma factor (sigma-70 family)
MLSVQPSLATLSDAVVLARFIEQREDAAFAELVRRHGPVVRAACRRALGASPDADDAFQVVFVILARKAVSLRNADRLGPWLHTVAVRAANRVRQMARRRQDRERQVSAMPEPALPPPEPDDWLPWLDAEIQRLPDRLRIPLVLCELEGKSRAESARLLGLKEGTLSSRLARAREVLRKRLRRTTGTVVAGAGLTAAFTYCREGVPSELLATTTQASLSGALSASVAALTQGVLQAMLLTKLKTALMIVLTFAILSGAMVTAYLVAVRPGAVQAKDDKSDKDKLQGTWEFVSGQLHGKKVEGDEADEIKKHKFVFKGDKLTAKAEATYTIDPSKKPKEIDLKIEEGPEAERGTWKGIYDLKGDELTLYIALPNQDRPTKFETKEGEMTMLLKLARVK